MGLPALPVGGVRAPARREYVRLKAFFGRQWRQMLAAQFMAVFGPYAQRIDQVFDRFDPAVLARAADAVTDSDTGLPIRPEESTR